MTEPRFVIDSRRNRYELGRLLGEGGQGVVYEIKGGKLAAKLLRTTDPAESNRIENQINRLKSLDLSGIDIAQPEAVLVQPSVGYTMRMLAGMEPLRDLIVPPSGTKSISRWYHDSGGLKRRLAVVARAAHGLSLLHSKGLCYGDVSPNNIYVSRHVEQDRAFLIDADNLRYASDPQLRPIYTPRFGAPEILRGHSMPSSLSDAHALAVVVFQLLTLVHPLIGDAVDDGEPDIEEQALRGELPWIDHRQDRSNGTARGIPRESVLSARLRELCDRAFTRGLTSAKERPSASEWAEQLEATSRNCVRCSACSGTFLRTLRACPWCGGSRPTHLQGRVQVWDPTASEGRGGFLSKPGGKEEIFASFVLMPDEQMSLSCRLLRDQSREMPHRDCVRLELKDNRLRIERLDDATPLVMVDNGRRYSISAAVVEIPSERFRMMSIHAGDLGKLHRVLQFHLEPESGQ